MTKSLNKILLYHKHIPSAVFTLVGIIQIFQTALAAHTLQQEQKFELDTSFKFVEKLRANNLPD